MMQNKFKKAKFFCENCGSEVPQKAKVCTKCGKFFSFTRCPRCFYTGDAKLFTHGCPECGYAIKKNTENEENNKGISWGVSFKDLGLLHDEPEKTKRLHFEETSLPIWIYIVTLLPLFLVLCGLYSCLKA